MFKDEANGAQVVEFVGLRPKMYSYLLNEGAELEKHRAKGIQLAVAKKLRHADYIEQLQRPKENHLSNRRLQSKLHRIYSITVEKRGLCAFDDKRVIMEDGVTTFAYGHYAITGDVLAIGDPANVQALPPYAVAVPNSPSDPRVAASSTERRTGEESNESDEECDCI